MNNHKNIRPTKVKTSVDPLPAPSTNSNEQLPEPFIDKIEVARRLGRTARCVDKWMDRGLIPFFKIGRAVSFKWSEVEAHLNKNCRVSPLADAPSQFRNR